MQDNLRRVAELDELSGDRSKRVAVAPFINFTKSKRVGRCARRFPLCLAIVKFHA
jgi:hypothetical protein